MITFENLVKNDYPFLIVKRDNKEKYIELVYRQTRWANTQYEFVMTLEDEVFWMYVVEQNYCRQSGEFNETNSVVIPRKFITIKEVYEFINNFLNNPK